MLKHLVDGDHVFAVGPELGDDLGHLLVGMELVLAQEQPDGAGHHAFGGREHDVAGVGRGVSEGLVQQDVAVPRQHDLARRRQAVVHAALGPPEENVDVGAVEAGH